MIFLSKIPVVPHGIAGLKAEGNPASGMQL